LEPIGYVVTGFFKEDRELNLKLVFIGHSVFSDKDRIIPADSSESNTVQDLDNSFKSTE